MANITALQKNTKARMKEQGINTRKLTEMVGRKGSAVYDMLKGNSKNPSVFLIRDIATVLGTTVDDLMG